MATFSKILVKSVSQWISWHCTINDAKLFCDWRPVILQNDMTSVGLRWEELLMPLLQKYKLNITWGDQDLLNIIFHHNPGVDFTHRHTHTWTWKCVSLSCHRLITPGVICSFVLSVYRDIAGVSVQVELSSRSLHLRQQLRFGGGRRHLHTAWKQRSLPRPQAAGI